MRDFMVTHANVPRGARIWTFGAPGYLDDDGWRLEEGKTYARGGYVDLEFERGTATLLSPPDQVLRTARIDTLVLGIDEPASIAALQIFGRADANSPWIAIGAPIPRVKFLKSVAGVLVPMSWPAAWRAKGAIMAELKIVLAFDAGVTRARIDRIALYP
jgi:hypothetical protein